MKEQTLERRRFPEGGLRFCSSGAIAGRGTDFERIPQAGHKIQPFGVCVRPGRSVLKKTVAQPSRGMYDGAVGNRAASLK